MENFFRCTKELGNSFLESVFGVVRLFSFQTFLAILDEYSIFFFIMLVQRLLVLYDRRRLSFCYNSESKYRLSMAESHQKLSWDSRHQKKTHLPWVQARTKLPEPVNVSQI